MKLYHFSNSDFKVLKTSYFGINHYSKNEKEACNIKRSFCYASKIPLEHTLTGLNFRYTIEIDNLKIYDLDKDTFKLKTRAKFDINKIINYLKDLGYTGASYTTSYKCYTLFKAVKVTQEKIVNASI